MNGLVSLVGAGPGDPDLLTVKAVRRLAAADLVLHDALIPRRILRLAPRAHCFYVGKRAGRHSIRQQEIHGLLVRAARRGRRVVRLKGGDPFVFGRGGEEALALVRAGVSFEVIPGISTAIAAPSLAGIPVTHRGIASAFTVISGHAPAAYRPVIESIPPQGQTLVVLMGLATRAELAADLMRRGWCPDTPAAICWAAATAAARRWIGVLSSLGTAMTPPGCHDAPGVVVIGDVVSLADTIAGVDDEAPAVAARATSAAPRPVAEGRRDSPRGPGTVPEERGATNEHKRSQRRMFP